MAPYETANKIDQELFKKEMENLPLYGYGVKGFVLSMVEMAVEISNHQVSNETIIQILNIGKEMLIRACRITRRCRGCFKVLVKRL